MKRLAHAAIPVAALALSAACSPDAREMPKPPIAPAIEVAWGSGVGELGRTRVSEGQSQGPNAFVVDSASTLHVLDQVNARIERFRHGAPAGSISLPARPFTDIELDGDGGYVLLERHQAPALVFVSSSGSVTSEVPLTNTDIPVPSLVTGIMRYADGFYALVAGDYLVRLADALHSPVEPRLVPGQALANGQAIKVRVVQANHVSLYRVAAPGAPPSTLGQLPLGGESGLCSLIAPLPSGGFYLGVQTATRHTLFVLDASGTQQRAIELQNAGSTTVDVMRRVRLGENGRVYVMRDSESGVVIDEVSP